MEKTDYMIEARDDAADMADEFLDHIAEKYIDSGEASDDILNDYPNGDSYHHESHVDKAYSLTEAAELLDDLDDYEETDTGLWDGLAPREAISAQAAYTYGNAVYSMWRDIITTVNGDSDLEEIRDELAGAGSTATRSTSPTMTRTAGAIGSPTSWRTRRSAHRKADELKAAIKARIAEIIQDAR